MLEKVYRLDECARDDWTFLKAKSSEIASPSLLPEAIADAGSESDASEEALALVTAPAQPGDEDDALDAGKAVIAMRKQYLGTVIKEGGCYMIEVPSQGPYIFLVLRSSTQSLEGPKTFV